LKQHLTVEQLNILDFKKQKIIATQFGQYGNCVRNDKEGIEYFNLGLLAERITIGKMIEILESKTKYTQQIINEGGRYCVTINPKQGYTTGQETEYYNELCDALWESISYII